MWSGFQAKKLNTCGKIELEFAANRAKPENQAEFVPGRDPDKQKHFQNFYSINQIHHIACSARKRAAWFINMCPRKGGCYFLH